MTNLEETVARNAESVDLLKCSFCGKSQKQVKKLIAGPGVYICDECIELCNEIVDEELSDSGAGVPLELPKPQEIFDFLNQYVIGQEAAKRAMSVAVYNHYKRVQVKERSVAEGTAWSWVSPTSFCWGPPEPVRLTWPEPWPASSTSPSPSSMPRL